MLTLTTLYCALLLPQDSQPAKTRDPLDAFRSFKASKQDTVARGLLRRIRVDATPAIQRIVSMQRGFGKLPVATPPSFHEPEVWAKGVAPARKLVQVGTKEHATVRKQFPQLTYLDNLHREVWYDWGSGRILRRSQPLSALEQMENLWQGYPPGADHALARVLLELDKSTDKKTRKLAAYLGHLYADLDARVYENVTLYEAWYSGETHAVPDVDAIPFAVQILKDRSFKSPIPAGKRRAGLYQRIRDHAFAYRKHRTLREAAAAAFVSGEPVMDREYKKLVPRFHYLWATNKDDHKAVAAVVKKVRDRDTFLARLDKEITNPREDRIEIRDGRKKELLAMRERLREYVRWAVKKAEGW